MACRTVDLRVQIFIKAVLPGQKRRGGRIQTKQNEKSGPPTTASLLLCDFFLLQCSSINKLVYHPPNVNDNETLVIWPQGDVIGVLLNKKEEEKAEKVR